MRVVHVITDLNGYGGTEQTLLRYLGAVQRDAGDTQHAILVLKSCGDDNTIGAAIRHLGLHLEQFGLNKWRNLPLFPLRFARSLRALNPDVISAWLYHPILLAEIFSFLIPGRPKIVWHIRSLPSYADGPGLRLLFKRLFLRAIGLLSRLSSAPIITNSNEAVLTHCEIGYRSNDWHIVANGLEISRYASEASVGARIRTELGIGDDTTAIICVGRFVQEKAYPVFFRAVAGSKLLSKLRSQGKVRFIGVGHGISEDNPDFTTLCAPIFAEGDRNLMGMRKDVASYLAAADLFVLSSVSESFPNVVIEAMASGRLVVATKIGAVRDLGLDPCLLAEPGDASSLSEAIDYALGLSHQERNAVISKNLEITRERFSLSQMIVRLDQLIVGRDA